MSTENILKKELYENDDVIRACDLLMRVFLYSGYQRFFSRAASSNLKSKMVDDFVAFLNFFSVV